MYRVIEELSKITILHQADIIKLKARLEDRLAQDNARANALADMIHRILDGHLVGIAEDHRKAIRLNLIKRGLAKQDFTFGAHDLFISGLLVEPQEETYYQVLADWANARQDNLIGEQELQVAATRLQSLPTELWAVDLAEIRSYLEPAPTIDMQETAIFPTPPSSLDRFITWLRNSLIPSKPAWGIASIALVALISLNLLSSATENPARATDMSLPLIQGNPSKYLPNLPNHLLYKEINSGRLQYYLHGKNSLLAEEPYFSTIISSAREFNLNPLLLFAITGQEQAFVPKTHVQSAKIANNPFNVFHSWQEYNTDINDTSRIAARTVVNLSKQRPANSDPFQWINQKYAEDQNWWKGVKRFYQDLEKANSN